MNTGRRYPKTLAEISDVIQVRDLSELVSNYLHEQDLPGSPVSASSDLPLLVPDHNKRVYVFHSASITFCAPSDPSSTNNMQREHVQATPSWWGGHPRYDCIFASNDSDVPGFRGLLVGRLKLLFSFTYGHDQHQCALVEWFTTHGDQPDEDTGLHIPRRAYEGCNFS